VDSTPVDSGRSKETAKRSDLAGWAEYGYCAYHSGWFWDLRLHLVCTLGGLPVGFALTGAKADERQTLLEIFHTDPTLTADRPGQNPDRGQELVRRRIRNSCCPSWAAPVASRTQGRARTRRRSAVQTTAANH
jgi:hypothetical protein